MSGRMRHRHDTRYNPQDGEKSYESLRNAREQ